MEYNLTIIFLCFIIYSFFGWIIEIIYCSIDYKKIVNRGFLFGPYCPIYGVGSILILLTLLRYHEDPVVVFVFGVLITSTVEYYTSYLLEKIFHNKWWDYSYRIDNINGRICVGNMLLFGFASCAIIYISQPMVMKLLGMFSMRILNISAIIIAFIFTCDVVYSTIIAYALRTRIIIAEELKAEKLRLLPKLLETKYREKISKLHFKKIRYFKSFPNLKNKNGEELDLIKSWLDNFNKKKK